MYQDSEYVSGCNYRRVLNIPELPICQVNVNARITQSREYAWIWLNNNTIMTMEEFWICLGEVPQGFNMPPILHLAGLGIRQGCEYERLSRGAEYISFMTEHALIVLNMLENASVFLNKYSSEYVRVLNVFWCIT